MISIKMICQRIFNVFVQKAQALKDKEDFVIWGIALSPFNQFPPIRLI
jgi:hypothetical protein